MFQIHKLVKILIDPLYRSALIRGVAAGVEHAPVLKRLGCRTVVDVGANRGQFALVARRCFPHASIVSFEPLAEPAGIFQRVFAEDNLVEVHSYAVGPERTNAAIHISFDDDSSSLLPIGEVQIKMFPRAAEKEIRKVSVVPLRDVMDADSILEPALLKIDVQGYELEVLRGCEPLLGCFNHVYVECSFVELYQGQAFASEVISFLAKRGFQLAGVYNMCYDRQGRAIQGDFLFSMRD